MHKLGHRGLTFQFMIQHLEKLYLKNIIETGTARIKDNWAGDGQSTLIWDWYINKYPTAQCVSIDLSEQSVNTACEQTSKVKYICGDSISVLNSMADNDLNKCGLFYMDSFDLDQNNPLPSSLHHLMELTAVWRFLPSGCMIVVDDCISNEIGKHILVRDFFDHLSIKPAFIGYQCGWIKP